MRATSGPDPLPSLPQADDEAGRAARLYHLTLARTAYNYTTSYLAPTPLSAQVPASEKFSLAYQAKVAPVLLELLSNFEKVLLRLFEEELRADLPRMPMPWMVALREALAEAEKQLTGASVLHPLRDLEVIRNVLRVLHQAPPELEEALGRMKEIPEHLTAFSTDLKDTLADMKDVGVTAFLKDTIYELLRTRKTGDAYLHADAVEDFRELYPGLAGPPRVMTLVPQDWMALPPEHAVWESDWYFGWLQIAGFNTTNLKGVFEPGLAPELALALPDLLAKIPLTDAMLQAASLDPKLTVKEAAARGRLFTLDMSMLDGVATGSLHGDPRYVAAAIAVFYWNPSPPAGYPPGRGSLQPVAIQLSQKHDPRACPVFVPGGDKAQWKLAKFYVLNSLAVQHETVAHLGACHLTVETLLVATRRRLSVRHPVLTLLHPHFRFTLEINDSAKHSLIIPGGVVASVLSTDIEGSLGLVRDARLAWRFDQNLPHRLFSLRGVDASRLPEFPLRDDTLLLWEAIRDFVRSYLRLYYADDHAVEADWELQAWVQELTDPQAAAFQGFSGLAVQGEGEQARRRLVRFDYLVDVVSLIIYTAGPQHAGVNFAQYPLMSYLPSVSGTAYAPPPEAAPPADGDAAFLRALPPLDVALYQLSFGYLLSSVQFDTFGHYSDNPRRPYFADARAEAASVEFRLALHAIEAEIHRRNAERPLPHENQLPSMIPNSISI